jgi:hypothetical protein
LRWSACNRSLGSREFDFYAEPCASGINEDYPAKQISGAKQAKAGVRRSEKWYKSYLNAYNLRDFSLCA